MALIIMLAIGLIIQAAMLVVMVRTMKPPETLDPLELIKRAKSMGVTEMKLGNLEVKIERELIPSAPSKVLTPEERKAEEEALLLHSVS